MEKIIITSAVISILYCVVKYIENRVLYKPPANDEDPEPPSMKPVFRDGILIFICCVVSMFALDQIMPAIQTIVGNISTGEILDGGPPKVFTNIPDF